MHYELVSRTLAYISCITTMSLFATSMAIAAVNVGRSLPSTCAGPACVAVNASVAARSFGGLTATHHVDAVAAVLWSRKI